MQETYVGVKKKKHIYHQKAEVGLHLALRSALRLVTGLLAMVVVGMVAEKVLHPELEREMYNLCHRLI